LWSLSHPNSKGTCGVFIYNVCACSENEEDVIGSQDSDKTVMQSATSSQTGDMAVDPADDTGYQWKRDSWSGQTLRLPGHASTWSDVTIRYNDIIFAKDSLIGKSRFGEVHK
jgi:hypothetical protein